MQRDTITIDGYTIDVHSYVTAVVGSGAAGLSAADWLCVLGHTDICLVTETMSAGTSRNTGSDKQTYYKLTMSGSAGDSVREMAETLYNGGAMHGDIALVEAALSSLCFNRLVYLGVPFPCTRYGEYAGYRTDHDPRQRATSAGPYTSRYMTECLEAQVRRHGVHVLDGIQIIAVLTDPGKHEVRGLMGIDTTETADVPRYVLINCTNVIYATGGPAGMYGASVYPESQLGGHGAAFEAGVVARNLTESQFGIASTTFRWNLSGTYQQAIPRYISTSSDGSDEREFLEPWFTSPGAMLDAIFRKGYEWPFDPRKVSNDGSSLIDMLVYNESVLNGRRVFLDYTKNPSCADQHGEMDFSLLGREAYAYLEKSDALFGTPAERLMHMNGPAYNLYSDRGIKLDRSPLQIAVCAQHNNGGLAGDIWWHSTLKGFFPIGEVNGSHGVYRPGGSALNAGQAGSLRAAQFIHARRSHRPPDIDTFVAWSGASIRRKLVMGERMLDNTSSSTSDTVRSELNLTMDRCGALIRNPDEVQAALKKVHEQIDKFENQVSAADARCLAQAFRTYDLLVTQFVYLSAIADYIAKGGGSRGSYLICDKEAPPVHPDLPECFCFKIDEELSGQVQSVRYLDGHCECIWEAARPIPQEDAWFETVWRDFRSNAYFDR